MPTTMPVRAATCRSIAAALAIAAAAGCQSYAPRPIDLSEVREAIRDRPAHAAAAIGRGERTEDSPESLLQLRLEEAEQVALLLNPRLRTARLAAGVEAAAAAEAGRWQDPTLSLDLIRFVELADEPWVVAGMIGLTLPLSGRLSAERELAEANASAAIADALDAEWRTRTELRRLWSSWSAAMRRGELLAAHLERFDGVAAAAERLVERGELGRAEGRLLRIDRGRRSLEQLRAAAEAELLRQRILALLGFAAEAPVALDPDLAGEERAAPPPHAEALAAATERQPRVRASRLRHESAERALALEIRKQWPDLHLGGGAQSDEGRTGLLLGFSLPIPILNGNRQGIAIARAARELSAAEFAAAYESASAEISAAIARIRHAAEERTLVRGTLVPLADAQWEDARQLVELGSFDAVFLIDSLDARLAAELASLDATLAAALAAIDLDEAIGPPPNPEASLAKEDLP